MKYLITERQYKLLSEEEDKIEDPIESLKKSTNLVYNFESLSEDWDLVLRLAKGRPFIIKGDLDLRNYDIKTLGSLVGVEGNLNLGYNKTIESLGNLKSVGGYLFLEGTNIESLENLESVGGDLFLGRTPLSKTTTKEEIRNIPNLTIEGEIFL